MPVYRSPRSSTSEPPSHWVLNVACRSLQSALKQKCARRHDADLRFRSEDASDDDTTMHVQILFRDLAQILVRLSVTHVGGNVHDVFCSVEDGDSRRFSYSLPEHTGTSLCQAPSLGRKMADFLLEELEKRLGRRLLQRAVSPPDQPSSMST